MIEIAKALSINAKILIMDEPTSALTSREIDELFNIIRKLKSQGCGIVYISHRLEELAHITDRVTIMRDGHYITEGNFTDLQWMKSLPTWLAVRSKRNSLMLSARKARSIRGQEPERRMSGKRYQFLTV